MSADVILVGCTKTKASTRTTARDLYEPSDLFRRRRTYAEATGAPWAILSALHGVVEPGRELDPYEFTIAQRNTADFDARGWAIAALQACFRLAGRVAVVPEGERFARYLEPLTIEVHAGIDYVRTLSLGLPAFSTTITLDHPVHGMQIGQQKAYYLPPVLDLPPLGQLSLAI